MPKDHAEKSQHTSSSRLHAHMQVRHFRECAITRLQSDKSLFSLKHQMYFGDQIEGLKVLVVTHPGIPLVRDWLYSGSHPHSPCHLQTNFCAVPASCPGIQAAKR